jgi:hypothetical protein
LDEELDDETKLLRQKQLGGDDTAEALKVCVIAPAQGGRPLTSNLVTPDKIEGFSPSEAMAVLERLTAVTVSSYSLFLDAFPPSEDAVMDGSAAAHANNSSTATEKSTAMPSDDNMRIFARFVHNSTFNGRSLTRTQNCQQQSLASDPSPRFDCREKEETYRHCLGGQERSARQPRSE